MALHADGPVGAAPAAGAMPAGSGNKGSAAAAASGGDAAPSDVTPSFLQLDGGLSLPPLEEEEFNSAFLDS